MDGKRVDKVMVSTSRRARLRAGERTREHSLALFPALEPPDPASHAALHRALRDYSIAARMHAVFRIATEILRRRSTSHRLRALGEFDAAGARWWSRRWRCSARRGREPLRRGQPLAGARYVPPSCAVIPSSAAPRADDRHGPGVALPIDGEPLYDEAGRPTPTLAAARLPSPA